MMVVIYIFLNDDDGKNDKICWRHSLGKTKSDDICRPADTFVAS